MSDPLVTYLQDHLAGAMHAIEVLKLMRDQKQDPSLGQFAAHILAEVEADRDVLAGLVDRMGVSPGGVKEWAAWLTEKVSRLKLKHESGDGLGTFEALEFLVLGIHGKSALWRALAVVAGVDSRLQNMDLPGLIARADTQHDQVDARRLASARAVFSSRNN